MICRPDCGACCICLSISTALPGHPDGKAAETRCVNLTDDMRCRVHGTQALPMVCSDFTPTQTFCGSTRGEALRNMRDIEARTRP